MKTKFKKNEHAPLRVATSYLLNDTKKHTSKSRETIPLKRHTVPCHIYSKENIKR
jgi:hypothetical protein